METLNKNAFALSFIAVIFGLLGFVLGRQAKPQPHGCAMMQMHCPMKNKGQNMHRIMMDEVHGNMDWVEKIDVQKEEGENGEQQIKIKVKTKEE